MATKVVMEALSPTMEEGRLVKWVKQEGEKIAKGDVLAEVETDKAVMELVARGEGVLRKRLLPEGETAPVGQLVGVIGAPDENIDDLVAGAGGPVKADERATPPSEVVARTEESAGASSVPRTPPESQGESSAPPQQKTQRLGNAAPRHQPPPLPEPSTEQAPHALENGERPRSSPLARRLASEQGLDLQQVNGSGPGGRIIRRDIEAALRSGAARPAAAAAPVAPRRAAGAEYTDIPLTQIRKTIAKRLTESIGPVPTFYLTAEFDLTRVAELRDALNAMGDEYRVSFNDVILKAVATALAQHPEVNAHWLGDRIREFDRVHLGMAVATDDGLIVPVIFDADSKRMSEISREARELAKRARERKLKPEEYTGSTFSVSNLGMFGIDQFTAIINPPEAGILAIGAVEEKPVLVNGELESRRRLRVTMSCDHRVIDGAVGARFLQTLRRMIENPLMLVY
ncbi:MAG TPA: pyruvate dehydrogenase complex dihydrolipoamide acetyltransferase [Gemmatimonadaceae bacterium]|nr:pyruvate dehydrogenase complex dihydrolipoamide acetyltransferase [Gemmatimonadaceae bacterium]